MMRALLNKIWASRPFQPLVDTPLPPHPIKDESCDPIVRIRRAASDRFREAYREELRRSGMSPIEIAKAPPTDLPWLPVAHTRPYAFFICDCPGLPSVQAPSFWGPR